MSSDANNGGMEPVLDEQPPERMGDIVPRLPSGLVGDANRPFVRGTKLGVDELVKAYQAGRTKEQFLEQFPGLTSQDFDAAIEFWRSLHSPPDSEILDWHALVEPLPAHACGKIRVRLRKARQPSDPTPAEDPWA